MIVQQQAQKLWQDERFQPAAQLSAQTLGQQPHVVEAGKGLRSRGRSLKICLSRRRRLAGIYLCGKLRAAGGFVIVGFYVAGAHRGADLGAERFTVAHGRDLQSALICDGQAAVCPHLIGLTSEIHAYPFGSRKPLHHSRSIYSLA